MVVYFRTAPRPTSSVPARCRQSEMQILDAYSARPDEMKSGALEQRQHLRQLHVAVPAPEMPCNAPSLRLRRGEVDQQHPAAGFDDPAQFGHELPPGGSAEVMKHHRAD